MVLRHQTSARAGTTRSRRGGARASPVLRETIVLSTSRRHQRATWGQRVYHQCTHARMHDPTNTVGSPWVALRLPSGCPFVASRRAARAGVSADSRRSRTVGDPFRRRGRTSMHSDRRAGSGPASRRATRARGRGRRPQVRGAVQHPPGPPAGPVLDLYAGTGAARVRRRCRGAPRAVFVERDAGGAVGPAPQPARDGPRIAASCSGRTFASHCAGSPPSPVVRTVLVGLPGSSLRPRNRGCWASSAGPTAQRVRGRDRRLTQPPPAGGWGACS